MAEYWNIIWPSGHIVPIPVNEDSDEIFVEYRKRLTEEEYEEVFAYTKCDLPTQAETKLRVSNCAKNILEGDRSQGKILAPRLYI